MAKNFEPSNMPSSSQGYYPNEFPAIEVETYIPREVVRGNKDTIGDDDFDVRELKTPKVNSPVISPEILAKIERPSVTAERIRLARSLQEQEQQEEESSLNIDKSYLRGFLMAGIAVITFMVLRTKGLQLLKALFRFLTNNPSHASTIIPQ